MKTKNFVGALVFLFLLAQSVSAYYTGGSYYSRLPYYEQTNFFSNADLSRQTIDTNSINLGFNQDVLRQSQNFRNSNQQLGAQAYLNNMFSNINQNRGLSLADGYTIDKQPITTRKIKVNNPGKKNDFTITETINDGISGTFFKDNRYTDALRTNYGSNQYNLGAQAYNVNNLNEGSANRNAISVNGNLNTQSTTLKTLKANIGKGDLIILN